MANVIPLGARVRPEVKEALERAARDDSRSMSGMVEKILADWLRGRGYLVAAAKGPAAPGR